MKPFIPQWKRDQNNINHRFGYKLNVYPGQYAFVERLVQFDRKKQGDSNTEVIQVTHLGNQNFFGSFSRYHFSPRYPFGLILGPIDDNVEDVHQLITGIPDIDLEYVEELSKKYQVYITITIDDVQHVVTPTKTFTDDEGFFHG